MRSKIGRFRGDRFFGWGKLFLQKNIPDFIIKKISFDLILLEALLRLRNGVYNQLM